MKEQISRYTIVGIIAGCLLTGGITFIFTSPLIPQWFGKRSQSKTVTIAPSPNPQNTPPTAINIPKIKKNLPIKSATVHGNNWDMYGDAVAWLSTSATPGRGNVILYAHDWVTLWADLILLKPGDDIQVKQADTWKKYKVTESRAVDQHDIQSILSDKDRLTMYTCEGSFDQKRRVVYAEPVY